MKQYFDLGGGIKVIWWKDGNDMWHMKSDLIDGEYVSYEKFDRNMCIKTTKFNRWLANANRVL